MKDKKEIRECLEAVKKRLLNDACEERVTTDDCGERYASEYLGSCISLDPCGRYHHFLSPNGMTRKCERFWETLDRIAEELDGFIEFGEGDPTDVFFGVSLPTKG